MKRDGQKIVAVVVYDYPMARVADRAGVDIVSVGDSVGVNLWGHAREDEVTLEQMLLACTAVRRGVDHALVSCDVPVAADPVTAAQLLGKEGGADLVKIEAGPETIRSVVDAGIAVWAQISGQGAGVRGQGAGGRGQEGAGEQVAGDELEGIVREAQRLEQAGASLLDFRHSGAV